MHARTLLPTLFVVVASVAVGACTSSETAPAGAACDTNPEAPARAGTGGVTPAGLSTNRISLNRI
ncbi:MAG: hypothetical protein JST00_01275, partial [Deltaproteobacteria bacterium]|nr:hypothetical protein [Deltaproteobacteria bacterium]